MIKTIECLLQSQMRSLNVKARAENSDAWAPLPGLIHHLSSWLFSYLGKDDINKFT